MVFWIVWLLFSIQPWILEGQYVILYICGLTLYKMSLEMHLQLYSIITFLAKLLFLILVDLICSFSIAIFRVVDYEETRR